MIFFGIVSLFMMFLKLKLYAFFSILFIVTNSLKPMINVSRPLHMMVYFGLPRLPKHFPKDNLFTLCCNKVSNRDCSLNIQNVKFHAQLKKKLMSTLIRLKRKILQS